MKGESIGWLLSSAVLMYLIWLGFSEIFTTTGYVMIFVTVGFTVMVLAAGTTGLRGVGILFPKFFDPFAAAVAEAKKCNRKTKSPTPSVEKSKLAPVVKASGLELKMLSDKELKEWQASHPQEPRPQAIPPTPEEQAKREELLRQDSNMSGLFKQKS